jgi:TrmH family RNA methyltransferase
MIETITSIHNSNVKRWYSLLTKKGRDLERAFLIEGVHLVHEAIKSGAPIHHILYVPDSPGAQQLHRLCEQPEPDSFHTQVSWIAVSDQVMGKITDTQVPQGVAAILPIGSWDRSDLLHKRPGFCIALDAVQDPGNVGTIIRAADASGASVVFLGIGCADLYNPKTIRSTMGSIFHLPIISCNLREVLPQLRAQSHRIIATTLQSQRVCYEVDLTGEICFILGNEGAGISNDLLDICDEQLLIPMHGRAESLNVAMAATVLLYEAVRQHRYATSFSSPTHI